MSSSKVRFAADTCFLLDTFKGSYKEAACKWIKFFDKHLSEGGDLIIIPAIVWSELSVCEEEAALILDLGLFEILPFDQSHAETAGRFFNALKGEGKLPERAKGARLTCIDDLKIIASASCAEANYVLTANDDFTKFTKRFSKSMLPVNYRSNEPGEEYLSDLKQIPLIRE